MGRIGFKYWRISDLISKMVKAGGRGIAKRALKVGSLLQRSNKPIHTSLVQN
jgi:hypothetical protein